MFNKDVAIAIALAGGRVRRAGWKPTTYVAYDKEAKKFIQYIEVRDNGSDPMQAVDINTLNHNDWQVAC